MPVIAISLLSLLDRSGRTLRFYLMPEETLLAALAGLCSVVIAINEGPANLPALGLAGLALAFACSLLIPASRLARDDQQAEQHANHG